MGSWQLRKKLVGSDQWAVEEKTSWQFLIDSGQLRKVKEMGTLRDLTVYKKSFATAMEIYEMCKTFPAAEKYSLVSQIIRSSRSVCSCLGEAYRKRNYAAHFISKITDADMENGETLVWLDFSLACKYIDNTRYQDLRNKNEEIGRLLGDMINHPEKYGVVF